jgi:hypothetical protein
VRRSSDPFRSGRSETDQRARGAAERLAYGLGMRVRALGLLGVDEAEGNALGSGVRSGASSAEGGGCGVGKRQMPLSMPSSGD